MKSDDMRLPLYLLILKWHSSNINYSARILTKAFYVHFLRKNNCCRLEMEQTAITSPPRSTAPLQRRLSRSDTGHGQNNYKDTRP
jgi:hypothetical protein